LGRPFIEIRFAFTVAARGFLELQSALTDGERVNGHRFFILMKDEFEPVGQQGTKHHRALLFRGRRWRLGDNLEPVRFEPAGSSKDGVGVDAPGRADEIHQGRAAQLVSAPRKESAVHERSRGFAYVNIRGLECRRGCRSLPGCQDRKSADKCYRLDRMSHFSTSFRFHETHRVMPADLSSADIGQTRADME
jgi:hypothetical protein